MLFGKVDISLCEETVKWYLENQERMDHVTSGEYQKYYENMYKDR